MPNFFVSLLASASLVTALPLAAFPDGPPDGPHDQPGTGPAIIGPPGAPPIVPGPGGGGGFGGPPGPGGPPQVVPGPGAPPVGPPPGIPPPGSLPGQPDFPDGIGPCTEPRVRKAWNSLSPDEKREYLRAVQCLMDSPPKGGNLFPSARTRFDDFVTVHANQTTPADPTGRQRVLGPGIHYNGIFLPWHRWYLWIYEETLIRECDYKGAQPFWDWSDDVPENGRLWEDASIFDSELGFGGNGRDGAVPEDSDFGFGDVIGSCVADGPFANRVVNVAIGYDQSQAQPHCTIRNLNGSVAQEWLHWERNLLPILEIEDYPTFWNATNNGLPNDDGVVRLGAHTGGHRSIGGEMRNLWSSANDPLFFMHHAGLDWYWSLWQDKRPENLYAIGGTSGPYTTTQSTLDDLLYMSAAVGEAIPAREVMDYRNRDGQGRMCYVYEDVGKPLPWRVRVPPGFNPNGGNLRPGDGQPDGDDGHDGGDGYGYGDGHDDGYGKPPASYGGYGNDGYGHDDNHDDGRPPFPLLGLGGDKPGLPFFSWGKPGPGHDDKGHDDKGHDDKGHDDKGHEAPPPPPPPPPPSEPPKQEPPHPDDKAHD